jgi:predicted XRE-type DNA-binding protein
MNGQNVYQELGFAEPQEMLLKAELAYRIAQEIRERNWTQAEAARFLGIQQPVVSDIARGQFHRISIERLMGYLRAFDPEFRVVLHSGK